MRRPVAIFLGCSIILILTGLGVSNLVPNMPVWIQFLLLIMLMIGFGGMSFGMIEEVIRDLIDDRYHEMPYKIISVKRLTPRVLKNVVWFNKQYNRRRYDPYN